MTNSPATVSASQVSLILERAAEIDARGDVLAVEELRRIAAEAGIDAGGHGDGDSGDHGRQRKGGRAGGAGGRRRDQASREETQVRFTGVDCSRRCCGHGPGVH